MWPYAALAGAIVVVIGIRRFLRSKRSRSQRIDVGTLSDSWLAEQRGRRNQ